MKNSLLPALCAVLLLVPIASPVHGEELVITLRNGKTIVLDTGEIVSMTFTKSGDSTPLVPSPRRFNDRNKPPGSASAALRPVRGPDGNLVISVTTSNVLPNNRYDVHLYVNGRHYQGRALGTLFTDRRGFGQYANRLRLPPGEHVLAVSITEHNSEGDIYVSPGIYENGGTTVRIPR